MPSLPSLLVIIAGSMFLCCPRIAIAQRAVESSSMDRISQRWLPMPDGGSSDTKQQTMLLQQLRALAASDAERAPLAELSDEQLQQIEETFGGAAGRVTAGDLESLSGGWIGRALADPTIRKQAQRLLEQYARDRQLPSPRHVPSPRVNNGVPLPENRTGARKPSVDSPHRLAPHPFADQPRAGKESASPAAQAQRLKALQDRLTEWLRGKARNRADAGVPTGGRTRESDVARDGERPPATSTARPRRAAAKPRESASDSGAKSASPRSNPRSRDGRNATTSRDQPSTRSARQPADDRSKVAAEKPSAGPRRAGSRRAAAPVGGGARPSGSVSSRASAKASARPHKPTNVRDSTAAKSALDIGEQLERYGLGKTVRRVVAKALRERRASRDPDDQSEARRGLSAARAFDWWQARESDSPKSGRANQPRRRASKPARTVRNVPPRAPTASRVTSTADRFLSGAPDLWKSVASAPRAARLRGLSAAPSGSASDSGRSPGAGLLSGPTAWGIVTIFALVVFVLLLARGRAKLLRTTAASEALGMQEVLAAGIRTRGDVIRAFHRFVLQRPQPAASWWTHRDAAKRLCESAPHLRAEIHDLAGVYEQARYSPPDTELSGEQIDRVQAVLRQCAT